MMMNIKGKWEEEIFAETSLSIFEIAAIDTPETFFYLKGMG